MTDNTQKFSGKAEDYDAGRPAYAEELIDELLAACGGSGAIADVGAGTGIFTEQLLRRSRTVYAVEPNAQMRAAAVRRCGGFAAFHAVDGEAAHTRLEDGSVSLVTAAQAFHWFDPTAFGAECNRITGGGYAAIVYNNRKGGEVNARLDSVCARLRRDFDARAGKGKSDEAIGAFFGGDYQTLSMPNPVSYERDGFIGMMLSRSYAPRRGEAAYAELAEELGELFESFAVGGRVVVLYECVAFYGRPYGGVK